MKRFSIYARENDKIENENITDYIFRLLKSLDISGATVFKTIYSYGSSKNISNVYIEVESYNMGIKIDAIDEDHKIYNAVNKLKDKNILITVADCLVIYGDGKSD
jgi:PII-like signaling protein